MYASMEFIIYAVVKFFNSTTLLGSPRTHLSVSSANLWVPETKLKRTVYFDLSLFFNLLSMRVCSHISRKSLPSSYLQILSICALS